MKEKRTAPTKEKAGERPQPKTEETEETEELSSYPYYESLDNGLTDCFGNGPPEE